MNDVYNTKNLKLINKSNLETGLIMRIFLKNRNFYKIISNTLN